MMVLQFFKAISNLLIMKYVWDVKITQVNVKSKLELDIGLQKC
jgi:hypothetical protein